MFGRRRIFLIGTLCLLASSLFAATATSAATLLFARFLQGTSAAMINATQIAIVSSAFPAANRGRLIGFVVAAVYAGLAMGPLLGGYIVEHWSWRATLLIHLPLALVVAFLGFFKISSEWKVEHKQRFDIAGALNYAIAIALMCGGVSLMPDAKGIVLIVLGLACMVYFFHSARRKTHPIWHVELFFTERLFRLSCLASLLMYSATYANLVLISLYLQYIKQLSAASAGHVMMLQPLTMAIFSPIFGLLSDRIQPRILASGGMLLTATGLLLLSRVNADTTTLGYTLPLLFTGFGFSLFSSPNSNAIMSSVNPNYIGHAASSVATMRVLGQLVSIALVTLIVALTMGSVQLEPSQFPKLQSAIQYNFTIAAGLCIIGCGLSLARGRLAQ